MEYKPRLTRPEAGNKYYITRSAGGWSDAVKGSPTDKACDVLHNCVGYAYGRFNEIGGYGSCKYLRPVNAENFMQYKGGLESGMEPRLGACMVWQKGATLKGSDGAGHVAIVEQIISPTEIVTSESGYGAKKPFWTQRRKKNDGNWQQELQGKGYKFLGFIYNPAVPAETVVTKTAQKPAAAAPKTAAAEVKAQGAAKSFNLAVAGSYTVTAGDGLHLRDGAGSREKSLVVLPCGAMVRNYGYYTETGGMKWLYVQAYARGVTYTGFCAGQYLKKV